MSAICGVVHRAGGALRPDAVTPMMRRLAVYGPDGSGTWQDGPAALGCQHLHVTPESEHEHLPLTEGGVTLVADVRLDNRDELLPALGVAGADAARTTDPALLLRAYLRWGEACVEHLVGEFAFAVWDGRRGTLFCARDHLGMRPFYYHPGADVVAFASTMRAILDVPGVPWEVDEVTVADYLTAPWAVDPGATHFMSIRRLPPAHTLTLHRGEIRIHRYWTPDLHKEVRFRRDEEYVEAYRAHLERAVRDRVRTTHGVASFLSGGLDSPAVASLAAREMARVGRPRLTTYTNVLADGTVWPAGDERALAESVLAVAGHMEGHFVDSAGKSMARSVLATVSDHRLPGLGSQFLDEALAHARRVGARVLLDGYGGDHAATSSGAGALHELLVTGRWLTFIRLVRARARGTHGSGLRIAGSSVIGTLRRSLPIPPLHVSDQAGQAGRRPEQVCRFVAPDLAARLGLPGRLQEEAAFIGRGFRRVRDLQWYMLSRGQPHRSVEGFHATFAGKGVERALPMLDRRLVEYVLAVPCDQHWKMFPRSLIRRAMEGLLPDAVRLREDKSKAAIPAPPRYVAGDPEELRALLDRMDREPIVGAFINVRELRECLLRQLPRVKGSGLPGVNLNLVQRAFRTGYLLAWVAQERRAVPFGP